MIVTNRLVNDIKDVEYIIITRNLFGGDS